MFKKLALTSPPQLRMTLMGGQSFRWQPEDDNTYLGVFANIVWRLKATNTDLQYMVLGELPYPEPAAENIVRMKVPAPKQKKKPVKQLLLYPDSYYEDLLTAYFRLEFDLDSSYKQWNAAHQHFATSVDEKFQNIRQLNIDCVENLFSFICSQNNNISRISSLVNKLCVNYGEKICAVDNQDFYSFPGLDALSKDGVEENLRELGFGYRAKYIQKSAQQILDKGGLSWFQRVSDMPYEEAHTELTTLNGIGPKVADCICLMSLNHLSAVPVDTHIIKIAKHYLPEVANVKNLTPTLYRKIGNEFRRVYGDYSGWAQTCLFVADLREFKEKPEATKSKKQKKS